MGQDLLDRFTPVHSHPTNISSAGMATWAFRLGHRCLKFPRGATYECYFASVVNSLYDLTGMLVTVVWTAGAVTAGVTWEASFERQQADVYDYSAAASFGTAKTVVEVALTGVNLARYSPIEFSALELGGLQPLESYRLRLRRTDAVAMDAFVYRVFVQNLL
ncbi:MAG TPA: hypothetical protein VLB12_18055 [Gemmatimonadales bacterium]|nr:hypothetical protein [Gemmatimonadales bacterium]